MQTIGLKKAKEKGYRSRAVFKLEEILKKTKIMNYSNVLDLGSSPGGWSEYIIKKLSQLQKFFAIDIIK
jgi:23S rRNA methylase